MDPARIVSLEEFREMSSDRRNFGSVVATSGGFDPIHPGHLSCITQSKKYGQVLVVIVNGDDFLIRKKGKPFQDLETRCRIVSYVRGVDYVVPFEAEEDTTVIRALKIIRPEVFTKGGDRVDEKTIPEWDVCQRLGIMILTGIGDAKLWSSSDFLREWEEFRKRQ